MKRPSSLLLQTISKLLLALLILGPAAPLCAQQQTRTFTFAVIPQFDARHLYDIWNPVLERLEAVTHYHFVLDSSPDIPTFGKRLVNGIYDFVYTNPLQYLQAARSQGYQAILRDGGRNLQGIVVVRRDSGISALSQLQGRPMALPSVLALGASLMVRYELETQYGIKIEPHYVKNHNSVYLQVATGRFPVGGGVESTLMRQAPEVRDRLRIIYRTQDLKPHPIAVHPRISRDVVDKVRQAFLDMAATRDGQRLLAAIPLTRVVPAAADDYQELEGIDLSAFSH
jgi:phosphonate transport system substrate-binding protein